MATFSDLIQRVLVELRQEPGVSVQQYSEDIVAAIMQRCFNTFFDHYWWPVYTINGEEFTLNGTNGRVVEDLTKKIKRPDDLRYIWYETDTSPLPVIGPLMNPSQSVFRKHYMYTADEKIFAVLPPSTAGKVRVTYRALPDPFKPNDIVKLDGDLLVLATCFNYVSDDDDNIPAVKKFAEAAGKREGQLREAMNRGPYPIGVQSSSPFDGWMMNP